MADEVWAVKDQVPWNYIAIIDAAATESRINVFRYSNQKPESGLPEIYTEDSWTAVVSPGLADYKDLGNSTATKREPHEGHDDEEGEEDEEDEHDDEHDDEHGDGHDGLDIEDDHLQPLLELAEKVVPEVQRTRTPLFLHATGSLRQLQKTAKHELLRKSCRFFQNHSKFLMADCASQVYDIDGSMEAILAWLSVNYMGKTLDASKPIIDLTETSLLAAYQTQDKKAHGYRVSLGTGEGTNNYYDVATYSDDNLGLESVRQRYVETYSGQEDPCMPTGLELNGHTGTGDYQKCTERLKDYSKEVTALGGSFTEVAALDLFAHNVGIAKHDATLLEEFCTRPWADIEKEVLTTYKGILVPELQTTCFDRTYALDLVEDGFQLNGSEVDYVTQIDGLDYSWTVGRALLYACDDVTSAKSSGVQPNSGGSQWYFGTKESIKRPKFKGDFAAELDKGSHRLWGGIVFLLGLVLVVYLLLGKTRRSHIYESLMARFGRKRYINVRHGDFELDEFEDDDEYDVR